MSNNGKVIQGDCIEEMQKMEENSVDAVVTDPPYGLAFMGKSWDDFEPKEYQEFCQEWGEQALRVLKPGGHLLAFSGTRTYHRMVVGLEDAGFEIRDQIAWMYGSGFPKGQDISKAIDKHKGKEDEREEYTKNIAYEDSDCWGTPNKDSDGSQDGSSYNPHAEDVNVGNGKRKHTRAASEEAAQWSGWNTSLKPGHEPVVVAQKPREGTYAENTLKWGVGGLNIDGCRITTDDNLDGGAYADKGTERDDGWGMQRGKAGEYEQPSGRWPGNVVLDQQAAAMLDQQSGLDRGAQAPVKGTEPSLSKDSLTHGDYSMVQNSSDRTGDSGGASRFFYSAKARKTERNAGLQNLDDKKYEQHMTQRVSDDKLAERKEKKKDNPNHASTERPVAKNDIATLKPINLMRWLCRLVTPENGTVLDPFAGSGTTGCAAEIEGFDYKLIEKRERFAEKIIPLRLDYWSDPSNWDDLKDHKEVTNKTELQNGSLSDF